MNNNSDLDFQVVIELINSGKYYEAKGLIENSFGQTQTFDVFNAYAIACFKLNEHELAIRAINRAIALAPDNITGHNNKIEILRSLSKFDEMISAANELELVKPGVPEVSLLKAQAYAQIDKPYPAVKEYKKFIKLHYQKAEEVDALTDVDTIYHVNHVLRKKTKYVDYPLHVAFETYAQCNAKCSFCVYPDMERIGTMMPMELIDKIISDLERIPKDLPFQLSPFAVNEPFLDKRIFTILEKITDRLPNAHITLTSNGTTLNKTNISKLSKFKLDYLWLSVVDHRKDVYEEKMKLNYDLMMRNLGFIHEAKLSEKLNTRVVVSRLKDNTKADDEFVEFIKQNFPLFEVTLWPYANWLSKTDNAVFEEVANIPCDHWFDFRISATGLVQHCCMDGHVDYPWGDVSKQSVLEIYNQEKYRQLRVNTFSRKEVSPCNGCTLR